MNNISTPLHTIDDDQIIGYLKCYFANDKVNIYPCTLDNFGDFLKYEYNIVDYTNGCNFRMLRNKLNYLLHYNMINCDKSKRPYIWSLIKN